MINDTDRGNLPLPTEQELLVIEHVLYRCVHRHTERSRKRDRLNYSTCLGCAEYDVLGFDEDIVGLTDAHIADMWRRRLPRPETHLVVAEQALAELRREGWQDQILQSNSAVVCSLRKAERLVRSKPQPTKAQAIVEAVAQIAKTYRK